MSVETYPELREAVAKLCAKFPGPYWQKLDREMAYPTEFVDALTDAGWLSVLIPESYGGAGLPRRDGADIGHRHRRVEDHGAAGGR